MDTTIALATKLGELLFEQKKTVTTAESCTGGGIAQAITEVAGASQWFNQGFVTYSNSAKHHTIKVNEETLEKYGAVSDKTVEEMAVGALSVADADIAVSVSGIAGPSGGSADKPVGLVWFGIALRTRPSTEQNQATALDVKSFKHVFTGGRSEVREKTVNTALEKLAQCLVNQSSS
ncbi:MAG: CinA family protein [Pseudomonadota bacterium]